MQFILNSISYCFFFFFFFNDTATTEIYTHSLHDALPMSDQDRRDIGRRAKPRFALLQCGLRSEEHTSELQSRFDLVCRLLLEKKKKPKLTLETIPQKLP